MENENMIRNVKCAIIGADDGEITTSGRIVNGAIYLHKGCYGVGVSGLTLENVVIFLWDKGMTLPSYTVTTTSIVTEDRTRKDELGDDYSYLFAPAAAFTFTTSPEEDAAIRAAFAESNKSMTFVGQENDKYYYGGREDYGNYQIAYFAAKEIYTAEEYENFVKAASLSKNGENKKDYLLGATVELKSDVTVLADQISSLTFAGTLLGNGHTVTIEGVKTEDVYPTIEDGYLLVKANGKVEKLALAFKNCTIEKVEEDFVSLIASEEGAVTDDLVLVVYQKKEADVQSETKALVVNVYGAGSVAVSFGDSAISFTAKESGNYALKEWKQGSTSLGNDETITSNVALSAHFALRYYVGVEYVVDPTFDAIIRAKFGDLDSFEELIKSSGPAPSGPSF